MTSALDLSDAELAARLVQHGHLSPEAAAQTVAARDTEGGRIAIRVLLDDNEGDD